MPTSQVGLASYSINWKDGEYGVWKLRCRNSAITFASSARPKRTVIKTSQPDADITAIPNGVDSGYFQPQNSTISPSPSCVFIGALDYKPNIDGVTWFFQNV